jgi:hypothetical protein
VESRPIPIHRFFSIRQVDHLIVTGRLRFRQRAAACQSAISYIWRFFRLRGRPNLLTIREVPGRRIRSSKKGCHNYGRRLSVYRDIVQIARQHTRNVSMCSHVNAAAYQIKTSVMQRA